MHDLVVPPTQTILAKGDRRNALPRTTPAEFRAIDRMRRVSVIGRLSVAYLSDLIGACSKIVGIYDRCLRHGIYAKSA